MKKPYVNPLTITPNEDQAMFGLSWAAQLLYLRSIRRYVNYSSGLAGCHDIRLSWQRFRDNLEVIRPARSKKKTPQDRPSRQFIRERLKELEQVGLIVIKPNPKNLPFSIFFLPLTPAGQMRLAKEQPLISMFEEPAKDSRLMSPQSCGSQSYEQPRFSINEQPQSNTPNIEGHASNVIELSRVASAGTGLGSNNDQPVLTPNEQPVEQSRVVSATQCTSQVTQQPQNTPDEQPYIYTRKKEIEERNDLDQKQKERIFLLFDRLVSDPRLHSLDKHFSEFLTLSVDKELTFDELRDILNNINDPQFSVKLIGHQLNFIRKKETKAKPKANQVKPTQPKATKPKPANNSVKINEISSELDSLKQLLKHSPDNSALIDQQNKLETELQQLRQA